ncbi:MAG: arylsulfatase [Pedosphaera sp. Tous-C6FEB]|nr:MAG: arylsulfatase [Pedosphaera sp. Tous-C6FEB]
MKFQAPSFQLPASPNFQTPIAPHQARRFFGAWALVFLWSLGFGIWNLSAAAPAPRPNLIYVLCDDLGYGDVKCLNPKGKIPTPHLDKLAAGGMIFTDVHSSSSVCTPTRYGVMTGRYNWRTKLQASVLGGLSPRLIEPGRLTVADLLRNHGYHTAAIGKWHLGMDWVTKAGQTVAELNIESAAQVNSVDYAQPIKNGPNAVGFDYYYGISASLDMVPYTFIENDRVTKLPTVEKDFPMFLGRDQGKCRRGPAAPDFEVEDVLPTLTAKAISYVKSRAASAKAGKPFFLYLPLASPHTPVAPTKEWQGKSGLNHYADFVMQTDHALGQLFAELDKQGLAQNTLVIVTSDNGCSPQANFPDLLAKGHNPSADFRGHKADIFDGGHRVPFLVRWPARVKANTLSQQTLCLTDLMATAADLIGAKLPDTAGEDSVSFLPALLGQEQHTPLREAVVHHSINGSFAIRQGHWKLALCRDSGGWSDPRPGSPKATPLPPVQLFNLDTDRGEQTNVQDKHPEVVARLTKLLEKYVAEGRSTPGERQKNAVAVKLVKATPAAKKK